MIYKISIYKFFFFLKIYKKEHLHNVYTLLYIIIIIIHFTYIRVIKKLNN